MRKLKLKEFTGAFPCGSAGKESACSTGDLGSIPGLGRFPGEGRGYPLQDAGLENPMDCVVHGVAKSQTRLRDFHFPLIKRENRGFWSVSTATGPVPSYGLLSYCSHLSLSSQTEPWEGTKIALAFLHSLGLSSSQFVLNTWLLTEWRLDSILRIPIVVTAQIMPGIHQPLFERASMFLHKRGHVLSGLFLRGADVGWLSRVHFKTNCVNQTLRSSGPGNPLAQKVSFLHVQGPNSSLTGSAGVSGKTLQVF